LEKRTRIEPADPEQKTVTIKIEYVDQDRNVLKTEEKDMEKDGPYDVSGDIPSAGEINGQKYTTEISGDGDPVRGTADADKTIEVICVPEDTDPTEPGTDPKDPTTPGTDPADPTGPVGSTIPNSPTTPTVPGGTTDGVATTQNLPAATPVAVPAAAPVMTAVADDKVPLAVPEENDQGLESLEDDQVPLANKLSAQWALLNLILAILTVLISVVLLIGYFTRKKHEEDDNSEEVEIKKKGFARVLILLPALAGVILFILTEDMTNPMVFTDQWTIWMAVIALLNVIVAFFSKKKEQDEDEDNGQNYGMA
jgi:hypothetical protein